jgi:hypothetical protein
LGDAAYRRSVKFSIKHGSARFDAQAKSNASIGSGTQAHSQHLDDHLRVALAAFSLTFLTHANTFALEIRSSVGSHHTHPPKTSQRYIS